MTSRLLLRAESVARAEKRRRVEQIAARLRDAGLSPEAGEDSVVIRGASLLRRWLAEPLLRFSWSAR